MEITRRTVLGAGAALPLVTAQGASAGPSPGDWADLNAALRGSVSLPGTSDYRSRAPLFDPHWDFRRPAAVARVLSTRDVATCVGFARDHGLRVTGRSGGHSYVGASATTGALVVDTRSLRSVDLTPDRTQTTVGAGAGLYSVHEALAAQGRSIPTGTCPTVGTAGLTLAGGTRRRQPALRPDRGPPRPCHRRRRPRSDPHRRRLPRRGPLLGAARRRLRRGPRHVLHLPDHPGDIDGLLLAELPRVVGRHRGAPVGGVGRRAAERHLGQCTRRHRRVVAVRAGLRRLPRRTAGLPGALPSPRHRHHPHPHEYDVTCPPRRHPLPRRRVDDAPHPLRRRLRHRAGHDERHG
ncbi:FAD-dependent oxidoreductase [Janibacter sp. YB324]|uniref:FAD-binding oxidoreductase n=1 Tax=Janibacter sp. YB324 TaxID=2761047 RepID=UPI0016286696|nr:FAD-dependent oxidoreductase [Janibacter sp. YB324]